MKLATVTARGLVVANFNLTMPRRGPRCHVALVVPGSGLVINLPVT